VRIKIIPRLDLKKKVSMDDKKRKKMPKPPQKLFNPNDVEYVENNL